MYHKSNLNRIIADYTGQPLSKIEQDTDRDNYMNPIEARTYGIIDHIIGGDENVFSVKGSLRRFPKVRAGFCPTGARLHPMRTHAAGQRRTHAARGVVQWGGRAAVRPCAS